MRKPCTGSARLSVSSWKGFTPGEHAVTLMYPGEGSSRTADVSPDCATVREPSFRTVPISLRKEIGTVALHQLLDHLPGRSHEPPGRGANDGRPARGGGPPVAFMASPGHVSPISDFLERSPFPRSPAVDGPGPVNRPSVNRGVTDGWRDLGVRKSMGLGPTEEESARSTAVTGQCPAGAGADSRSYR